MGDYIDFSLCCWSPQALFEEKQLKHQKASIKTESHSDLDAHKKTVWREDKALLQLAAKKLQEEMKHLMDEYTFHSESPFANNNSNL